MTRRPKPKTTTPLVTFADATVRRHAHAAMTWLQCRNPQTMALGPEAFGYAAGHLRAIQNAVGLTPAQVCDALRIHGWRRRGVLPQSTQNYRFRMTKAATIAARTLGRTRHEASPTQEQIDARPLRRVALYRPRES